MNRFFRTILRGFRKTSKRVKRPGKRARGDTYADRVIDRLDAGTVHASLGPKLKTGSADRARKKVNWLVKTGLKPNHFVVDYGCGTLRVGALLIAYLEPDRYCGLDIDQRFLDIGREMLPEGLANSKRPLLRVISPAAIAEDRRTRSRPYSLDRRAAARIAGRPLHIFRQPERARDAEDHDRSRGIKAAGRTDATDEQHLGPVRGEPRKRGPVGGHGGEVFQERQRRGWHAAKGWHAATGEVVSARPGG